MFVWVDRTIVRNNIFEGDPAAPPNSAEGCVLGNDNQFFHNDFIAMPRPSVNANSTGNVFSLPPPVGGNYWSDHDCADANADGFCDAPVVLVGAIDELPFTVRSGWRDADGDGSNLALDCNDTDAAVFPGAPEVKHDGIDQDCNGYDLTIEVVSAVYKSSADSIKVIATSTFGAAAGLQLVGRGPMTWDPATLLWVGNFRPANGNPGTVIVSGTEGSVSAVLVAQ